GGHLAIPTGDQVQPRRGALEAVVDRRPKIVDMPAPQGQALGALVGLEPDAPHLRLDLTGAVCADAAAWSVAQGFRAVHRTCESGRVQHALTTHLAVPYRPFDRVLDACDRPIELHAGTFSRRRSISSFAFFTAEEASAEYPSAPTASAYSCV